MSRIGDLPIEIPDGVEVAIDGLEVSVSGPEGELVQTLPGGLEVERNEDDAVVVRRLGETRKHRSRHGLARSLVLNMVQGVTEAFEKRLEMHGVGYRAQTVSGGDLQLEVGLSHPVVIEAPDKITFETPQPTRIIVRGPDKAQVGQLAANIRAARPPEPYKGKGIRYEGERVRRKAGKAAAR